MHKNKNNSYTRNISINLCNISWESARLLNVFIVFFLQILWNNVLNYHSSQDDIIIMCYFLKRKVPPLLQYPYDYSINCYTLPQHLNDCSHCLMLQLLHAAAHIHVVPHHQNHTWRPKQRSRIVNVSAAPYPPLG